jgi:hypothetical protein
MESGYDLSELRPLNLDPQSRIRGNHKGPAYALNVVNPKPGRTYEYIRREEGEIQRFLNEGFQLEYRQGHTKMGRETDPAWGINLDGVIGRRDVVLVSIDDEGYAAYMERKRHNVAVQSADNAVAEFLSKGESMGSATGANRSLYRRASNHHTEYRVQGVSVSDDASGE